MSNDFIRRFTSRPFLSMVATILGTAIGLAALWNTQEATIEQKIEASKAAIFTCGGVIAVWSSSELYKDASVAKAQAAPPQTVVAGGDATIKNESEGTEETKTEESTEDTTATDDSTLLGKKEDFTQTEQDAGGTDDLANAVAVRVIAALKERA